MSGPDRKPLTETTAASLVGGGARRMGRDKLRIEIGGRPILERVCDAASSVASRVLLVGKAGQKNPLPDVEFIAESASPRSSLAGVVASLLAVRHGPVLVLAGDHPFLVPAVLLRLVDAPLSAAVRVPEIEGTLAPLVAAYDPARALDPLRERLDAGRFGLIAAVRALDPEIVPESEFRDLDPDLRTFLNVNDPASLERARRLDAET